MSKKKIIVACIVFMVIVGASVAIVIDNAVSVPQSEPEEHIVFIGSDNTTTLPFEITTKKWIVDWSYITDDSKVALFSFFIYLKGETEIPTEAVFITEETSGSLYSNAGPGEYYVRVEVFDVKYWKIIIKPVPDEGGVR